MSDADRIVHLAIDESECGRFIRLHFGQQFICELLPNDAFRFAQGIIDRANLLNYVPPRNFNPDRNSEDQISFTDKPVKLDDGSFKIKGSF